MPAEGQEICSKCGCIFDNGNHSYFDNNDIMHQIKAYRKCPICTLRKDLEK